MYTCDTDGPCSHLDEPLEPRLSMRGVRAEIAEVVSCDRALILAPETGDGAKVAGGVTRGRRGNREEVGHLKEGGGKGVGGSKLGTSKRVGGSGGGFNKRTLGI